MKRTLIISAYPACGRTYLFEKQNELEFGEGLHFSILDHDSSKYEKHDGWEREYVDDVERDLGTVDFIFVTQFPSVLEELRRRGLPFVMVCPDTVRGTEKQRQLIKNQWFGRIVLRDNSFVRGDVVKWFNTLKENYDSWLDYCNIQSYQPAKYCPLLADEYLSDIIEALYYEKERHPEELCKLVKGE